MAVTIYGIARFAWNDGTAHTFDVPIANYQITLDEEARAVDNESIDGQRRESDFLGAALLVVITGTHMAESSKATFAAFESWALRRGTFTFYPHYNSGTVLKPSMYPTSLDSCVVNSDYKRPLSRSEGIAGQFDFSIAFKAYSYTA
jgi:hypothetical protein